MQDKSLAPLQTKHAGSLLIWYIRALLESCCHDEPNHFAPKHTGKTILSECIVEKDKFKDRGNPPLLQTNFTLASVCVGHNIDETHNEN
jgi:hypothetical protein